jgi:hypothetical protein
MSGRMVGQIIGSYWGPIGSFIGGEIGNALFPSEPDGPQLDTRPQSSEYGRPLPFVYGTMPPNHLTVIWASEFTVSSEGGKGSESPTGQTAYGNFAVAICEGERSLGRIWAGPDKRLIWDGATLEGADAGAVLRFYSGTEDQLPDPLIESYEGVGNVPGYRGTAYVVFENFPLLNDGNRLPFLTIEVGADSSAAPENLGVVYVVQVLPFDDKYATFYWGTYTGVVIRYQADDTLYAHYTYDIAEWVLTFDDWFWDSARNVFVRYTAGALSYTTVDVTNGGQTLHTYSAAGGADSNPGINVVGACMQSGSYVFAAKGSTGVPERVTLYLVDPVTHTCTATYCGNLPDGEIAGPLMAPSGAAYVVGYSTGATDRASKFALSSGFSPVDLGSITQDAGYVDIDPNTSYIWSVKRDIGTGDITLTINDPATAVQIAQRVITGSTIIGIGSRPLTFIPGTPNTVLLTGTIWLATDGFRLLNATTLDDISGTDLVGGYYGTAAPMVVSYIPDTGGLISFREGGMMTFGTTADPTTLNFLQSGTFAQELDNKYLGEADGTVVPQGELLSAIVTDLSERAGLTAAQIDVTQLTDMVDGYCISSQVTVRDAILALMPAYFFDAVESEGKVKFVKRGGATAVVIPDEDVGCFESGSEPVEPLETTRRMEVELPRTMSVRYMLAASDYSPASKQAKRLIGSSGEERTLDMPLVFTDTKAQEVAEVNLHGEWVARLTYSFTLTRKYSYLEPTDPIVVYGHTMRLTKTVQADGIIKCEATHEDSNVYVPNVIVTETPPIDHGTGVTPSSETILELA